VSAPLTALIAEDEPHAREALRAHLAEIDWLEVVAVTGDGRSALTLFEEHRPRLLFLDVRLPELSGLEVARRLAGSAEIVFTTAYDRYAVSAFELGALDYLVKPFGKERLHAALDRVRARLAAMPESPPAPERVRAALAPEPLRWLFARSGDRIVPIETASIRHVQARGDYAEVRSAAGDHLLHVPLSELVERLDPERFLQIHRSHVVNLGEVAELRKFDERRLVVLLKDGARIVASRAASEALRRRAR
jgi:two-component system LytT family response regulator